MRTGKHQSKNYAFYAIKWAVNIMANINGYSVNRAYQIDRVFGTLVEQYVNYYKEQLEYVKRFSAISGAYSAMINDFNNFSDELRKNLEWFENNPPDYRAIAINFARNNTIHDPESLLELLQKQNTNIKLHDIKSVWDNVIGLNEYANFKEVVETKVKLEIFENSLTNLTNKLKDVQLEKLKVAPKQLQMEFKLLKISSYSAIDIIRIFNNRAKKSMNDYLEILLTHKFERAPTIEEINKTLIALNNDELKRFKTSCNYALDGYMKEYNTLKHKYRYYLNED